MKKGKILPILLLILMISLLLTGCAEMSQADLTKGDIDDFEEGTKLKERDILYSDVTAIDYLEGVWTTNKGEYIAPQRGDSELIVWSTNLQIPSCVLYVLREGVLYGGLENGQEMALLSFTLIDDERMNVTNLTNEREYAFLRERETVDTSRLDNEYVFHSMRHAAPYLSGMWMDEEGKCFWMDVDEAGVVSLDSDLPCPQVENAMLYDGKLCGESQQQLVVLFSFDIKGEDTMMVTCHTDGSETLFTRLSRSVEEGRRSTEYVFFDSLRAFTFLNGSWGDPKDIYFDVTEEGGSLSWKTNLPLDDTFQGYGFANGGLQGISVDENGEEQATMIYTFEIHSEDEITITVCETGESYRLERSANKVVREYYALLEGIWADPRGNYFSVTSEDGVPSMKTNLPLDKTFDDYRFYDSGLQGIRYGENGEEQTTMIYQFEFDPENKDKITMTVCETGESYPMERKETESGE